MRIVDSSFCCTLYDFGDYYDLSIEKRVLTKEILEDLYLAADIVIESDNYPKVLTTTYLSDQDLQYGISKVLEECGFEIREIPRKADNTKYADYRKLYFAINVGLWPSLIEKIERRFPPRNNEEDLIDTTSDPDVPF